MLGSKNVTKRFGSKTAVDHISLKLEKGQIYGMLGSNGSGKTTWMKMAAGLIKPTEGAVYYNGQPVDLQSRADVTFASTEPYFCRWMTIRDAGKNYADFFSDFRMEEYHRLLERMGLDEKARITGLSTGMTAKMKIAVNLARDSKVYMLDEPFNGIDLLATALLKGKKMGGLLAFVFFIVMNAIISAVVQKIPATGSFAVQNFIYAGVYMVIAVATCIGTATLMEKRLSV